MSPDWPDHPSRLRDNNYDLGEVVTPTRDLTEQSHFAEARPATELLTSRDQFAAILAGVNEGITVQDAAGRLVYANDAAARRCGFPNAAGLMAAPVPELVRRFEVSTEEGEPFPIDNLPGRRLFRGEPAVETLVRFRDVVNGEVQWSLVNATPINDDTGRIRLAVNIFHDVTEHKRIEDTARFLAAASVELTRSLDYEVTLHEVAQLAVPSLADWCVVDIIDDDGRLRRLAAAHVDPAKVRLAEQLTRRYPEDPTDPQGIYHVLRTGRSQLVPQITDAQIEAGARDSEHLEIVRSLQIRSAIVVPLLARGHTLGAITLVQAESGRRYGTRDLAVAEELAVRAALAIDNARLYREAQRQTARQVELNVALREAMGRLQEALRSRDDVLAAASHDLKNPLTSIKAITQLLRRRLSRPGLLDSRRVEDELERIDTIVSRAASQVDELLDVARLNMGRSLDLDRQPTDLVALTSEIVAEHRQKSDRHLIQVDAEIPELLGPWDRRRLARVIDNLIDNAFTYSPEGGEIWVRVSRDNNSDGWAVLTVDDTGMGIPPEDLGRIFERFQRGSNVVGLISGTGIGLASARHIVESHGGTIAAANRMTKGSSFTIRLPLENDTSSAAVSVNDSDLEF